MARRGAATTAQVAVWLAAQREPESWRWNVPIDLEFLGTTHLPALRVALTDVVARHPALRSHFTVEGGVLRSEVSDVSPSLVVHRRAGPYRRDDALSWAAEIFRRPLALDTAPVMRADLLAHPDGCLLAVVVHHIVADLWSQQVFREHLVVAYRARQHGREPELPAPRPDAASARPPDDATTAYWRVLLADGEFGQLAPSTDRVRPEVPGPPRHGTRSLGRDALAGLRAFADEFRASPAVVVLAAWCLLLHAHSGVDDGVVGMPFGGRNEAATHNEIGLYTQLLPVRSRPDPARPFGEFVGDLRDQVLASLEHCSGVDDVAGVAGITPTPFRVVYAHAYDEATAWVVDDARISAVEQPGEWAKYDLSLDCTERSDEMQLRIDYDDDVYLADTVELLLDQLTRLVAAAVTAPSRPCRALLSGLADCWPLSGAPAAPARSLPELVLAQAAVRPDATAVRDRSRVLTYAELVARAGRLAHWLGENGAGRGQVVALLTRPGADTIIAMLAASLAGAAYLPLDPDYPDAQLTTAIGIARPAMLLTDPGLTKRMSLDGMAVHAIPDALAASATHPAGAVPPVDPDGPLTILFTSGSTGTPKGVVVPHAGMSRLMHRPDFLGLGPDDVVSHLSPLNFDGSTFEIWGALTHGAELVVLPKELVLSPRELRTAVRANRVTTLLVTTPLLNHIVDEAPDTLQTVRRVYFGGELVSVPHVRRALAWCLPGTLLHSYGPTENSFTSTWHPIDRVDARIRTIPIGRPVPGTDACVVFEGSFDPAPPGVPGELLLGGAGVATGYLGDPVATGRVFVPDPLPESGGRWYRTGDRVRLTARGELEFVGRIDTQVKVRSQRVELGEIDAALRTHDAVDTAFVTTRTSGRAEKEIVAYVVPRRPTTVAELRAHLTKLLPPFAVPSAWALLDRLPTTDNGKIDRRRLPEAYAVDPLGQRSSPTRTRPQTGPLARVRAAWAEVLGHADFADDGNFFDVGGHSLALVALQDAMRRHTGHGPSIADLMTRTTVRAQVELVAGEGAGLPGARAVVADADDGIAIIGMACRLPQADDTGEFWANLRAARDGVSQAPGPLVSELGAESRRIARYGSLGDPVAFDATLFGFPAGSTIVDAQYGVMYECLWSAVEDAALRMSAIADHTAVYVGCARQPVASDPGNGFVRADDLVGTDPTFLPTRFSYWYDLRGESVLVETACSTSLVAVHLASESLRSGRCDYALAGGVSIQQPAGRSYVHVPGQLFSADGYCRPFDRRATGTVPGDGAGAVLLRRLSDALRDGDPIHAVIRGSAVNNDGRPKVGYSAPGVAGQVRVIQDAHAAAGVDGRDIDYLEAHGTGTRLGDAIEAIALTEALGPDGPSVGVGSVKSSIGHTNTAAGVAGLIKTVLALRHGYLPATLHVGEPIEELSRFGERFRLVPEGQSWPDRDRPRIAGVSSFGVGGTNAHVIVQGHTPAAKVTVP